jgi:hypothetical protein
MGGAMTSFVTHRRRLVVVLVAAALCAGAAALFMARSSAASTSISTTPVAKQAPGSLVLAARGASGHDTLWLLPPAGGSATAAGVLPGLAGAVAVAPDGQNVAYLPRSGAPHVWIGYGPLAPRNISLTAAGVRKVDSLTWITNAKLLVSGVKTGNYVDPYKDRLFVVNASTGKVSAFRDLRGTEPSAAPGIGKVAYVTLTELEPGTSRNGHSPLVKESLRVLRLDGHGGGRTVSSERYRIFAAYRAMSQPKLSPSGKWVLTGSTGSDVQVTYALRDMEMGIPFLSVFAPALQAEAGWDASGGRTAFAGTPAPLVQGEACVWVYDTATGTLTRTPGGLLPDLMVSSLAWSPGGDLVAGAWDWGVSSSTNHVVVVAGDLASATDLGKGRLPVWVQQ